ncbi:MAG: DNA/RNA non-specific endonuclease [Bacteroidales bacterium]|nr:DNA/RNA non-specific endonuclease [Bacteroidales bacterium]
MKRIIVLALSLLTLFAAAVSCELLEGTAPGGATTETGAKLVPKKTAVTSASGKLYMAVTAKGDWSIELTYPSDGPSGWGTMYPASGSGNKGDVYMRYEVNESKDSRFVTVHFSAGGKKVSSFTVEQLGEGQTELSAGGFKSDSAPVKWLELPETPKGDGLTFYAHDMQGGGYVNKATSGTRNWSFYWSSEEHISIWVAYPLNKSLIGSGSRTNEWGLDPLISEYAQPRLISSSYGGGWTRGHQLPSADRLNYAANVSTFYGTNMAPQLYDFNGPTEEHNNQDGVWGRLEAKVRNYAAKADTLYVVTGCVLEGSTQNTGGSSGFVVKVPAAFFKALLYLSPNKSQYHKGYMAAGYYLEHSESVIYDELKDHLMSIDQLEALTGIDFFVNLPGVVGASVADQIEAETPVEFWK